jgi:hypothetical protein
LSFRTRCFLSAVAALETDLRFSGREDLGIIVAARSDDGSEIRPEKQPAEDAITDIRRAIRRHVSAERYPHGPGKGYAGVGGGVHLDDAVAIRRSIKEHRDEARKRDARMGHCLRGQELLILLAMAFG